MMLTFYPFAMDPLIVIIVGSDRSGRVSTDDDDDYKVMEPLISDVIKILATGGKWECKGKHRISAQRVHIG